MTSDDALMQAYGQGNTKAFDILVERYRAPVFGFLRRMLKDEAIAEDALMETFFKLHKSASRYQGRQRFRSYLFTLAYREGINLLRQQKRRGEWNETAMSEGAELVAPIAGPEANAANRHALRAIDEVVAQLPELQRAVFLLYYKDGLPTADIATAVEIPPGSVRAYLSMSRKAIRDALVDHQELAAQGI